MGPWADQAPPDHLSDGAEARACRFDHVSRDPAETDPDKYKVIFENERVRVLEYEDKPGERTSPHHHPDSVMYTLSSFERRLIHGDRETEVGLEAGRAAWLDAQDHSGENIGSTRHSRPIRRAQGAGATEWRFRSDNGAWTVGGFLAQPGPSAFASPGEGE